MLDSNDGVDLEFETAVRVHPPALSENGWQPMAWSPGPSKALTERTGTLFYNGLRFLAKGKRLSCIGRSLLREPIVARAAN